MEKENIIDAFNNEPDCEGDGDRYYTENYTENYTELDGSKGSDETKTN